MSKVFLIPYYFTVNCQSFGYTLHINCYENHCFRVARHNDKLQYVDKNTFNKNHHLEFM